MLNEKVLRNALYNAIVGWYDDLLEEYNGLDDENFIHRVCKETGITKAEYNELMLDKKGEPNDGITFSFSCDTDLSKYVDSMLFDSGTIIATGKFTCKDKTIDMDLRVNGEVDVDWCPSGDWEHGNIYTYKYPSYFPIELENLIRSNPNQWSTDSRVQVNYNNWFEYIFNSDGVIYEQDLSKAEDLEIQEEMIEIAKQYFD